jgi:hypothetical protein
MRENMVGELCIEEREKEEREVEKWSGGGVQFFPKLGQ